MSFMPQPKRLIVFISGYGSNMRALASACAAGRIAGDIIAVISDNPKAKGIEKAIALGLQTEVLDYERYDSAKDFELALCDLCVKYAADLLILAGFMRILTGDTVRIFESKIMNIHPSLLPKYKGLNTHQRVLENGDKIHGCSVHFVTEKVDDGPVIIQDTIDVCRDDTAESLAERLIQREHLIYPYAVHLFCAGRLAMQSNQCFLDGERLGEPARLPKRWT